MSLRHVVVSCIPIPRFVFAGHRTNLPELCAKTLPSEGFEPAHPVSVVVELLPIYRNMNVNERLWPNAQLFVEFRFGKESEASNKRFRISANWARTVSDGCGDIGSTELDYCMIDWLRLYWREGP